MASCLLAGPVSERVRPRPARVHRMNLPKERNGATCQLSKRNASDYIKTFRMFFKRSRYNSRRALAYKHCRRLGWREKHSERRRLTSTSWLETLDSCQFNIPEEPSFLLFSSS